MSHKCKLKASDVEDIFITLSEVEIQAAVATIAAGNEKDKLMGQGYIMAIERCRNILRSVMKDVDNE